MLGLPTTLLPAVAALAVTVMTTVTGLSAAQAASRAMRSAATQPASYATRASSWSLAAPAPVPTVAPARLGKPVAALVCQPVRALQLCSHGDDAQLRAAGADEGGTAAPTTSTRVGCYGDGTSGARIVTAYVRPVDAADRYAQYVDRFRGWAGALEKAVDDSAHLTRGSRHVRFVTTPGANCVLQILRLTLPADAFDSFTSTVRALQQKGFDQPGSKYLLWSDATGYCGIATMYADDTAGEDNANNGRLPTYARVDRSCWGYAEAHEVMHMLGGVSAHAPHGTAGYHCNDGADVMCYDDHSARSTQHAACGSDHARLFDCHSDDYFSTAPAPGSWLAEHWNAAFSTFLATGWTEPAAAPGADAPSPAPSPDPSSEPPAPVPPLPSLLPIPVGTR